jgi:hypothetical protein
MEIGAFQKMKSLVRTSNKLFTEIVEEVEKIFPAKKLSLRKFLFTVAEKERDGGDLVLCSLPTRKKKGGIIPTFIFIVEIEGRKVLLRVLFPLWGPAYQQDAILASYLEKIGLVFPVSTGGVVLEINLPFAPIEVKFVRALDEHGEHGDGQKSFICPDEIARIVS